MKINSLVNVRLSAMSLEEAANSKDRKQRKFVLWDIKSFCGNIFLSAIALFFQKQVARNRSCLNRGGRLLLELRQSDFFCGK